MVNGVKLGVSDQDRGPFYINEYKQVIVPAGPQADYYLAGDYNERLEFTFEGIRLSGDALSLQGERLAPGDTWDGPHPGIPYVLTAKNDICYEVSPRPNVTKRILLSELIERGRAREIAQQVLAIKGS
jgi:hypothetical protein